MTFDEAKRSMGRVVLYHAKGQPPERGVIVAARGTRACDQWVFVRYHGQTQPKATRPEQLELEVK